MAGIAPGDGGIPLEPAAHNPGRRRAAGIYGTIITAAILDTAGGRLSTDALAAAVVVTLLVYWIAEEYAEVLGEQATGGRLPGWAYITDALAATWPMVSASFAPLLALLFARLAGATALEAANAGLAVAFVLLAFHGWRAALAAQLRGWQLLAACSVAAALGLIMILLKDLVLIHLHQHPADQEPLASELALVMHGVAIRFWNYALYTAAIAAAVLILLDVSQPSDYAAEGYRVLWTLCGVGIGVIVMFLAGRLARPATKTPPQQATQPA